MTKRRHAPSWPPKGSYPHPGGGYGHDHIYVTKDGRRISITAKLKAEPDTKDLARAILELAKAMIQLAKEEAAGRRTGPTHTS